MLIKSVRSIPTLSTIWLLNVDINQPSFLQKWEVFLFSLLSSSLVIFNKEYKNTLSTKLCVQNGICKNKKLRPKESNLTSVACLDVYNISRHWSLENLSQTSLIKCESSIWVNDMKYWSRNIILLNVSPVRK